VNCSNQIQAFRRKRVRPKPESERAGPVKCAPFERYLDWEEINAVQRGNDLAPSQQFFQRIAPLQFLFLHKTLPESVCFRRVGFERKTGVQFHALLLATDVPTPRSDLPIRPN